LKARIKAAFKKKEEDEIVGQAHRLPRSADGNRSGRPTTQRSKSSAGDRVDQLIADLPNAKPRFIQPMKAKLVDEPPKHGDWIYELKFDGFRAIGVKSQKKVSLISRNEKTLDSRFPDIVNAMKNLPVRECVIDGEIVALDEEGRSSFQLLQALEMEGRKSPLRFYVFDLLQLDGKSLLQLPLEERKQLL